MTFNLKKIIVIGLFSSWITPIMAESVGALLVEKRITLSTSQQGALQLKTAIASPRSIAPSIRVTGKVIANPKEKTILYAPIAGKIHTALRALPAVGYAVKKNQILTHIERLETSSQKENEATKSIKQNSLPPRPQPVHSPIIGTLTQVWIEDGQSVKEQEKLFEVTDPYPFWVEVPIQAEWVNGLTYRAQAYTKQGKKLGLGLIDMKNSEQSPLFFRVESNQQGLKLNDEVIVYLQKNTQIRASLLPKEAVLTQNQKHFIWIKDKKSNDFFKVEVKAYPVDEQSTAVLDLEVGTIVSLLQLDKIK